MPRQERLDQIKIADRMFLFRPCVGENKYPGMISAMLDVMPKLDIEPVVSDEQTCCGGFLTFTNVAEPTSTMPAVARNVAIAEEQGLDVVTMCNGCYTFLTEFTHFMDQRPPVKKVVNTILSMIGRDYKGSQSIYHTIEVFYKLKDLIASRVERPLKGLRFSVHYGCHYLNGFKNEAVDDAFMPTVLEEIIRACGGEVQDYSASRDCCGTGLTQVILHKEEMSLPHCERKFDSLNEGEPDAVVVICPYCLAQLDRMQHKLTYRKVGEYKVPVLHVSQLVALALGVDVERLGFGAHAISFERFLEKLPPISADSPEPAEAAHG